MMPVSAVIIVRNEDQHIERCLRSVSWTNEIYVLDSDSTDRTREICLRESVPWSKLVRFENRSWTGFRDQRNHLLQNAKFDWVFSIDADEECSPELAQKIQNLLSNANHPPHLAYKIRRVEYFLGKQIRYGVWNPSYQDRFFNRIGVEYVNDVHEYPVFSVIPKVLEEPIHHSPDFYPEKFLNKMNRYTSIEARERVKNGQRTHIIHLLFAAPAMFLKNYFYYKAYRDGFYGLIISILEGISRAVRHIKIWQYSRDKK